MPRNYKMVPVELNFGLDGSDPKVSRGLLKVENGVWTREGAISKRREIDPVSNYNQNRFLADHGGSPITFSPALSVTAGSQSVGQISGAAAHSCSMSVVTGSGGATDSPSIGAVRHCEFSSGGIDYCACMYVVASEFEDITVGPYEITLYIDFVVRDTGQVILSQSLQSVNAPVIGFDIITDDSGDYVFGVFSDNSGNVKYFRYAVSGVSSGTSVSTSTYSGVTGFYPSACQVGSSYCVAVHDISGGNIVIIMSPTSNIDAGKSTATESVNGLSVAGFGSPDCCELNDDSSALVVWVGNNGSSYQSIYAREYDTSASPVAAAKAIREMASTDDRIYNVGATRVSDTDAMISWAEVVAETTYDLQNPTFSAPAWVPSVYMSPYGTPSADLVAQSAMPVSAPFIYSDSDISGDDSYHVWCSFESYSGGSEDYPYYGSSVFLVSKSGHCKAYALTGRAYFQRHHVATVSGSSSVRRMYIPSIVSLGVSEVTSGPSGVDKRRITTYVNHKLISVDFLPGDPPPSSHSHGVTSIGGAAPVVYDGTSWRPGPFVLDAPGVVGLTSTVGGSATTSMAGTFQFVAVYEIIDTSGNRIQSAPSSPTIYTHTGSLAIYAAVQSYPLIGVKCSISVYMSKNNGPDLFLVASKPSDPTEPVTLIRIDVNIEEIDAGELLYTQQGLSDNYPPPPYVESAVFGDRLVVVPSEYDDRLSYSKSLNASPIPSFPVDNIIELLPSGGSCVAIKPWLEKLFILNENSIDFIEGSGRSDYASDPSDGYERPVRISTLIGCAERRSVVNTGAGFAFWSGDIIYQISGGLQLEPIGEPVRYYTSNYDILFGFEMANDHCSVWITSGGHALAYDWKYGRWSTWSSPVLTSADDAITIGSTPYLLSSRDSGAYRHLYAFSTGSDRGRDTYYSASGSSPGSAVSSYYALKVDTGWTALSEHSRVYGIELHGYKSGSAPANLVVKEAYNYDNAWLATNQFDASSLTSVAESDYYSMSGSSDTAMTLYRPLTRTVANAYRIEISEDVSTGTPRTDLHLVKLVFMAREIEARQVRGSSRRIG